MSAVLSLGSNVCDRLEFLRLGLSVLEPFAVSRVWETAPWGGVEQDDFLNVVALCPWDAAEAWRRAVLAETKAGRSRDVRWGPRTLDVDVVWADGSDPALELPHPRAHERAFVLVPWLDVDPDAVLPGYGRVSDVAVDRSAVWLAPEQTRMIPTSWRTIVAAVLAGGILGWVLMASVYGDLVKLPTYAAVTAGLMAIFELLLARVVSLKVRGVSPGRRPMHPLQVARAAALAKASSMAGALLLGLYAGFFIWLLPRRGHLAAADDDVVVAGLSGGACLLLLVTALLLERACRTPKPPED